LWMILLQSKLSKLCAIFMLGPYSPENMHSEGAGQTVKSMGRQFLTACRQQPSGDHDLSGLNKRLPD
jgi:hypothetical protein